MVSEGRVAKIRSEAGQLYPLNCYWPTCNQSWAQPGYWNSSGHVSDNVQARKYLNPCSTVKSLQPENHQRHCSSHSCLELSVRRRRSWGKCTVGLRGRRYFLPSCWVKCGKPQGITAPCFSWRTKKTPKLSEKGSLQLWKSCALVRFPSSWKVSPNLQLVSHHFRAAKVTKSNGASGPYFSPDSQVRFPHAHIWKGNQIPLASVWENCVNNLQCNCYTLMQ